MLPKRLINLIGTVLALGLIAAGLLLIAGPVFLGSFEVEAQRITVAQSNDLLAAQVSALAEQAADLPALESELAGLRRGIPMSAGMDQVSALAVKAADGAGVELQSFDVGATAIFAPPVGKLAEGAAEAPAPAEGADAAEEPRQQVSVSIVVESDSGTEAADFVDRLRKGPRLLQIVQVVNTASSVATVKGTTTVTALAFVQHP